MGLGVTSRSPCFGGVLTVKRSCALCLCVCDFPYFLWGLCGLLGSVEQRPWSIQSSGTYLYPSSAEDVQISKRILTCRGSVGC